MELLQKTLLFLHVSAGFTSLGLFFIPAIARKGGKLHNRVGRWYVLGMWTVVLTALALCGVRFSQGHYFMALFLGFLALLTSRPLYFAIAVLRNKRGPSLRMQRIDWLLSGALAGLSPLLIATGTGLVNGQQYGLLVVFGTLGLLVTWPALMRKLVLGQEAKAYNWLEEHVSGMVICAIAAFTAFFAFGGRSLIGSAFSGWVEIVTWIAPTVIGVAYIRYYKSQQRKRSASVPAVVTTLVLMVTPTLLPAQLYTEKQTRHRFAEMTVGADVLLSGQGETAFLNADGSVTRTNFTAPAVPRLLIGGTHFWGHADFQIAFPLTGSATKIGNRTINALAGVETMFKAYPWRIAHGKLRPFIGVGLLPVYYEQSEGGDLSGEGPGREQLGILAKAGLNYRRGSHLFEAGINLNPSSNINYPLSRTRFEDINVARSTFNLTYRYAFDTTIGAEKSWESGRTAKATKILAERGELNNLSLIAGPTSAAWTGTSPFNAELQPWFGSPPTSIAIEFGLGYYLHQPDLNVALLHRAFGTSQRGYGALQSQHRRSLGLEVTKILGDYHGFSPFVGPILSHEWLRFQNTGGDVMPLDVKQRKWAAGITVGWDIRPNRLQSFILRTNVRYYPKLDLVLAGGETVSYGSWEINFIQLVVYPGRFSKGRRE